MKRLAAFAYGLIITAVSFAQVGGSGVSGITISGPITAGHCAQWATKSAVGDSGSACGGGGAGTVTSVGLSSSGSITVTGSPITTSGTMTVDIPTSYLASPPAIGGTAAAAGSFTTLSASSTVSGTGFSTYLASPPAIGGTAAAAGAFTTLSASSTVSGTGFSTYLASPPAIGGTAPAAGSFTTASAIATEPRVIMNQSGAGTDLKQWDFDVASTVLTGRTRTDADGAGVNWLSVTRGATTAISNISFANATNNPTGTWLGTGTFTFNGQVTVGTNVVASSNVSGARFTVTASTAPATGIYLPTTNTIGFAGNSASLGTWSSTALTLVAGVGLVAPSTITFAGVTTGTNADFACFAAGGVMTLQTSSCTISSRRFKENLVDVTERTAPKITALEVASFNMKPGEKPNPDPNFGTRQTGLIAENVAEVAPECAVYERDMKTPKSYRQECVIALLVKTAQEQQREIVALRRRVNGQR